MKRRLLIGIPAFLAAILVLALLLFLSGWRTAWTAARAVALGRAAGPTFDTDSYYYDRLGRPAPDSLRVSTLLDENSFSGEPPFAFQVNFALSNLADEGVGFIEVGVGVRFGLSGWQVEGVGSGG